MSSETEVEQEGQREEDRRAKQTQALKRGPARGGKSGKQRSGTYKIMKKGRLVLAVVGPRSHSLLATCDDTNVCVCFGGWVGGADGEKKRPHVVPLPFFVVVPFAFCGRGRACLFTVRTRPQQLP